VRARDDRPHLGDELDRHKPAAQQGAEEHREITRVRHGGTAFLLQGAESKVKATKLAAEVDR
jgi:hypothetical protein